MEDHPRACGEQNIFPSISIFLLGSPPRVRGTALFSRTTSRNIGITPARAGNRDTISLACQNYRDHPRACGEQTK